MSDDERVVSIDDYRHLTLQALLREWADIVREPHWRPGGEAGKLADLLEGAADALDGTLIVNGSKWVQCQLPRGEGA